MPDAPSPEAGSLSARAQEILRRADAQLAALRAPAPPPRADPEPAEERVPTDEQLARPPEVRDLGELIDTVEAGIGAARAHLITLSASLERIAEELDKVAEEQRRALPPQLASHARLPDEPSRVSQTGPAPAAAPEAPPAAEPAPEPEARNSEAASDAARLVAIEMAVAGDTREGVGRRLREEFGIRDPSSILDDAFGPDTSPPRRGYGA